MEKAITLHYSTPHHITLHIWLFDTIGLPRKGDWLQPQSRPVFTFFVQWTDGFYHCVLQVAEHFLEVTYLQKICSIWVPAAEREVLMEIALYSLMNPERQDGAAQRKT